MNLDKTIAAIATPPGSGAIGIIRLSGEQAFSIAEAVFRARSGEALDRLRGYTARLGDVFTADGVRLDECVALIYRAPKSYTGENAVELMCHGGEVVCEAVLQALFDAGAEPAASGEFTRRALLNGRLSLTEAEAVADVINAASLQGAAAAAALQSGALYKKSEELKARILTLLAHISAAVDFPEEDVEPVDELALKQALAALRQDLSTLLASYETGACVLRGLPTVIAGSPNVGKSTLLNLLAGAQKALVTPYAGTTRDIVEQTVRLGSTMLLLADTAGIRQSDDLVEMMGIERAINRLGEASLVLMVFDASRALDDDDRRVMDLVAGKCAVAVINKTDLPIQLETAEIERRFPNVVYLSANDPRALPLLDAAVARAAGLDKLDPSAPLLANERQRGCVHKALEVMKLAVGAAEGQAFDAVHALLAEALESIAALAGENMTEPLLDAIFSRFCVGK